jgi:hypothetical protein
MAICPLLRVRGVGTPVDSLARPAGARVQDRRAVGLADALTTTFARLAALAVRAG